MVKITFIKKINKGVLIIFLFGLNLIIHKSCLAQVQKEIKKVVEPKVITFNPDSIQYQPLLDGEKDSVVFYSSVVTLAPNKSGKIHNSEIYEEIIITLEGEGQLRILKHKNLDVKFGKIALVPPYTEHQMVNTGTKKFKYIYVATKSKK